MFARRPARSLSSRDDLLRIVRRAHLLEPVRSREQEDLGHQQELDRAPVGPRQPRGGRLEGALWRQEEARDHDGQDPGGPGSAGRNATNGASHGVNAARAGQRGGQRHARHDPPGHQTQRHRRHHDRPKRTIARSSRAVSTTQMMPRTGVRRPRQAPRRRVPPPPAPPRPPKGDEFARISAAQNRKTPRTRRFRPRSLLGCARRATPAPAHRSKGSP